ncbi:MAG: hypothetical protein RMJ43_00905 [Chloroherpetonaceae bacterium]|nr:hypothetical protein [Chloroherpetonaceae bacterium]
MSRYASSMPSVEPEKTTVIPLPRAGEPSVRITPGGLRPDRRVTRHFCLSLSVLAGVLTCMALAPLASPGPPRAPRPASVPFRSVPLPVAPAPVPPVPALMPPQRPVTMPPAGAAPLVVPVAQTPFYNARLLTPPVQPGFSVPPAVPIPADGSLMAW